MGIKDLGVNVDHLFSNGTEYDCFMEYNCFRCKKYVHFEDATPENPVCPIEEAIALAGWGETKDFPAYKLIPNGYMHRYDCTDKEEGESHEHQ